jgi:hypothetical protein
MPSESCIAAPDVQRSGGTGYSTSVWTSPSWTHTSSNLVRHIERNAPTFNFDWSLPESWCLHTVAAPQWEDRHTNHRFQVATRSVTFLLSWRHWSNALFAIWAGKENVQCLVVRTVIQQSRLPFASHRASRFITQNQRKSDRVWPTW